VSRIQSSGTIVAASRLEAAAVNHAGCVFEARVARNEKSHLVSESPRCWIYPEVFARAEWPAEQPLLLRHFLVGQIGARLDDPAVANPHDQ
jgi:hypothetical protein